MKVTDKPEPDSQNKTEFTKSQELDKHLIYQDNMDAQYLQLLNEALTAPKGDVVISVETYDRNLIRQLWSLQSEDVEISETLQKAGFDPTTIHLILADPSVALGAKITAFTVAAKQLLNVVDRSLDIVERVRKITRAHADDKNERIKTRIRARRDIAPKFLAKYQDADDVEVEEAEDERNPDQDRLGPS